MTDTEPKTETAPEAEVPKAEAAAPPPFGFFGSAAPAGTGFQFGSFAAAPTAPAPSAEGAEEGPAKEEECQAEFTPVIQLEEVDTVTGEESEVALFEMKAKVFRFQDEWKERGVGVVKLLEHKETKKCRLLMRRNKTLKICLNQAVQHSVKLKEHAGNDRALAWCAVDYADGEATEDMLAIKFGSVERAQEFKTGYEAAQARLEPMKESEGDAEPKKDEADEVAESLAKAKVDDDEDPSEKGEEA